jgi:hypothetical protein
MVGHNVLAAEVLPEVTGLASGRGSSRLSMARSVAGLS